ncbi:hypothetical protein BGZ65_009438, partial [Modicella reniformis]
MAAVACMTVLSTAEGHVSLLSPCPRKGPYKGCQAPSSGQPDYDITAPIGVYGETIKTTYQIGASHGGGHCQWALSYDQGKTWVVFQTLIRKCLQNVPKGGKYSVNVKIPDGAPSGDAIFMWLWNNAIGNRELYSNCVDVQIKGTNGGTFTGV